MRRVHRIETFNLLRVGGQLPRQLTYGAVERILILLSWECIVGV